MEEKAGMDVAPLDELVKELDLSRATIYRLIRQHGLAMYKRAGDRRTWLDRDQLLPLLDFQAKLPGVGRADDRLIAADPGTTALDAVAATRPSVASCYIVKNQRLLMVRRIKQEAGLEWAAPSGHVEVGETPEEAAVRDVREEVGLTVAVERLLGDRIHPATGRHLIYFACRIVSGVPALVADDEISAIEWCDLGTVRERWADLKGEIYPPVLAYLEQTMSAENSAAPRRGTR
jgi:8-oxo-dGTP diphosphatase